MTTFEEERHNVDQGWQPLIEKLHADLLEVDHGYEVLQIKEKFGGLRYYIQQSLDHEKYGKQAALINAAELASQTICEGCGAPGTLRGGSWVKTYCDDCEASRVAKRAEINERVRRQNAENASRLAMERNPE